MSKLHFLHSGGDKVTLTTPASNPSTNPVFKLPQADGTSGQAMITNGSGALAFASLGVTMADQWLLTSSFSPGGAVSIVTSGWGRVSRAGYGVIGSAMTQSSGVFTYPQTGIYFVEYTAQLISTSAQRYLGQR